MKVYTRKAGRGGLIPETQRDQDSVTNKARFQKLLTIKVYFWINPCQLPVN